MSDIKDYGKALFELAKEENGIEGVSRDVNAVISIVKKNPDYLVILNSPTLSKEEKRELIDEAFGTLNENLCNLLKLMCDKRMAHLYAAALQGFLDEYDAYMGILRVDAVTVRPLTQEQSERLTAKLEARTGKKVIINNIIAQIFYSLIGDGIYFILLLQCQRLYDIHLIKSAETSQDILSNELTFRHIWEPRPSTIDTLLFLNKI